MKGTYSYTYCFSDVIPNGACAADAYMLTSQLFLYTTP